MASNSNSNDEKAAPADKAESETTAKPASLPPAEAMPEAAAPAAKADEKPAEKAVEKAAPATKTDAAKADAPIAKAPLKAAAPPPSDSAPLKPAEIAGILAVLAIIAVGLFFLLRSPEAPGTKGGKPGAPTEAQDKAFTIGKTVDVELTLLPDDKKNVACASAKTVDGKHCDYEAQEKAWPTPDADASKLLKPYATTGQLRLLASGLWNDEAFVTSLPTTRFRAKCQYKLEGKLTAPDIRWNPNGPWRPQRADWWVGSLTGCKVL